MNKNKKHLEITVKNVYNKQDENFINLLTQGIKKIDLYNLQKQIVIKQREETTDV